MALYLVGSSSMPTTAAFATLATGAVIKTLLQLKPNTGITPRIVEWGISFDGSAAATPGKVELIETDVAATVTAHVTAGFNKYDPEAQLGPDPASVYFSVGSSASGYNASVEGTITAVRLLAGPQLIAPVNQFIQQYPLGQEPYIQAGQFGRIRCTFGTSVNAYAYMLLRV